jgi:penicillin-binding protein 1A
VGDEFQLIALIGRDHLPDQRRRLQPFGYFWKSHAALLDSFIRESTAYRGAVEAGATPEAALAQLKATRNFYCCAPENALAGGIPAIDPATGHIKAWVGGCIKTDPFDHVALARRQPGSTFNRSFTAQRYVV